MSRVFTDTHAHLSLVGERLGEDGLSRVLDAYASAWAEGERPLLVDPGVDPGDFCLRADRFGSLPFVRLAAGIWPSAAALAEVGASLAKLETAVADPRCAAVGECGPDYHHMNADPRTQLTLFEGQLSLARRYGRPVIVHSRDAAADTAEAIRQAGLATPVIIHCFGYGPAEVRLFLDLGCHISFAGNITYGKADELAKACRLVPADSLLIETDAPYMNPSPARGKPGSSLDISRTYQFIAELRKVDVESLAGMVTSNARAVFR